MAYEGKKHQRGMGLTNTVEVSSCVQRLLISTQHNVSVLPLFPIFSIIRYSSLITEECFNKPSLDGGGFTDKNPSPLPFAVPC